MARHVQASHRNESRLVGVRAPRAVVDIVFGTFGVSSAVGPDLLDEDPAPVPLSSDARPLFSVDVDAEVVAAADCATTADLRTPVATGVANTEATAVVQAPVMEGVTSCAPLLQESGSEGDGLPPALVSDSEDDDFHEPVVSSHIVDMDVPPLVDDSDDDGAHLRVDGADAGDHGVTSSLLRLVLDTDDENDDGAGGSYTSESGGAAEYCVFDDVDNYLNPTVGGSSADRAFMPRHVFMSSTAARIRAYYERLPEASMSMPVVDSAWVSRPTRFNSPALRGALRFALTAGGSGLSEPDQVRYAQTLRAVEREATSGTDTRGPVTSMFESSHSFLTGTRREVNRVLSERNWQVVPIDVGGRTFQFYYRDILLAGIDALGEAQSVFFGPNDAAARADENNVVARHAAVDLDGDDHGRVRRGSLDSDLYLASEREVKRLHGAEARVMGVHLHADEALVSWSGANYMFPIRAKYINVGDGGGHWVTVGYVEHVPKPVEKTVAARVAASDTRNDLFQRCLAVSLRRLVRASETGISAQVAGHGTVRLVPRVLGLVVDQVEERNVLALMGNRCNYFCSQCMEDKRVAGSLMGIRAIDRDVITTLDAQLAAALVREQDPRQCRRRALGQQHSALAFVPALGAVHGLSTGGRDLYRIVSFDVLHVWKLGFLRLLAQRLPSVLMAYCSGSGGARLGSVAATLDAINLRGFHLGRNCKAIPAPPGYVFLRR